MVTVDVRTFLMLLAAVDEGREVEAEVASYLDGRPGLDGVGLRLRLRGGLEPPAGGRDSKVVTLG